MVARILSPEVVSLGQSSTEIFALIPQTNHRLEPLQGTARSETIQTITQLSDRTICDFRTNPVIVTPSPEAFDLFGISNWDPPPDSLPLINRQTAQLVGRCNQVIDKTALIAPENTEALAILRAVNETSLRGGLPLEELQALPSGLGTGPGLMTALLQAEQCAELAQSGVDLVVKSLAVINPVEGLEEQSLVVCDFVAKVVRTRFSPPVILTQEAVDGNQSELDPLRKVMTAYAHLLSETENSSATLRNHPSVRRLHQYLRCTAPGKFEVEVKAAAEELLEGGHYGPLGKILQTLCLTTTLVRGVTDANRILLRRFRF